jgi:predicted RNase H-like nuclease
MATAEVVRNHRSICVRQGDPVTSETRNFATFVGIDLGGGKGKSTAVAVLQPGSGAARVCYVGTRNGEGTPFHDDQLLEFLREYDPTETLIAVDAPLTLTACTRCRLPECVGLHRCEDPAITWFRDHGTKLVVQPGKRRSPKPAITPYTQRACEIVLHRQFGVVPRETLGQGMGPLTARAHYLRRALEGQYQLNRNIIEVYPKATVQMLFDASRASKYKREVNTWHTRAEMLEDLADELRFEVWREGCLRNDHCFDAVLCAYTGYLWATEGWELPQQHREVFHQDGWIWFPSARRQPW